MDLKELCQEIDYQQSYTYEQRVDLFNKYKISTSKKFFNPFLELSTFILFGGDLSSYNRLGGYSHSGAIASSFNKTLHRPKERPSVIQNNYVRICENTIQFLQFDPDDISKPDRKSKALLSYDLIGKTVSISGLYSKFSHFKFTISRSFYNDIDRFLIDFGYRQWSDISS